MTNFSYDLGVEFGIRVTRSTTICAMFDSICGVRFISIPTEIDKRVIHGVTVTMTARHPKRARADERRENQGVDVFVPTIAYVNPGVCAPFMGTINATPNGSEGSRCSSTSIEELHPNRPYAAVASDAETWMVRNVPELDAILLGKFGKRNLLGSHRLALVNAGVVSGQGRADVCASVRPASIIAHSMTGVG